MSLPLHLRQKIEEAACEARALHIQQASAELSRRYREGNSKQFVTSTLHHLAYVSARLPATYAVNVTVLEAVIPAPESLLDLGAGPGVVMWVAASLWPKLTSITLIEQDPGFIHWGRFLSHGSDLPALHQAHWQQASLLQTVYPPHDLVTLSYVLNELSPEDQNHVVQKAWEATRQTLVLIEPGTPSGFQRILKAREFLIQQGATIFAPCPHNALCPLQEGKNWCHFSVRLPREAFHRSAKAASLGFEDEKYSYLIARKTPGIQGTKRIITKPRRRTGQVILDLCTSGGLERRTLSKKEAIYAQARKAVWGDALFEF